MLAGGPIAADVPRLLQSGQAPQKSQTANGRHDVFALPGDL